MILAVVIGYVLGIAPFVVPKIIEFINRERVREEKIEIEEKKKEQEEIFDEWLNGARINEPRQVNQQEIFEEYMTGKVKGA